MITIRKSNERGHANHGWLEARHTFSFASYRDPQHVHFRTLRVINEDTVKPAQGFGWHPHENMEIVTVPIRGELKHEDSLGHVSVMKPGEVQRMSAGTGIFHSEYNASKEEEMHMLQIWLFPEKKDIEPSYEQKDFTVPVGESRLLVSPNAEEGSLTINQDVRLYRYNLAAEQEEKQPVAEGRHVWIQVIAGSVAVSGHQIEAGDGAAISEEEVIELRAGAEGSDFLLFDLS